jgi:M6 family metalloprotease-like protein
MKKKLSLLISIIVTASLVAAPAIAAPKTGAKCSTKGTTSISQGKKYTCINVGSRLVWNKGVVTPTPTSTAPTASPEKPIVTETYTEPKFVSAAIDDCKIKENSTEGSLRGNLASGFPFMSRFSTYPKEMKFALVPIDFSDLQGELGFKSRVQTQMQTLSDWYSQVSGGKFAITWTMANDWIRLPGSSKDFAVQYSGAYPDTANFWNKVIPVVDSKMDLTGVQSIAFILPSGQTIVPESAQSFPFMQEMKDKNSSKTNIISFATPGVYFESPVRTYWSYWAHEFGHTLGLAHVGSSRGSSQTMNGYDLLGNQDGPYRELSGWMRFIIGWLDDSQVYCQDPLTPGTNEITLIPLNDPKAGIKTVIIPTSQDSAIVIDSRRPTKFSCTNNLPSGVLVYTYDAKLGNQSYFLTAQYPSNRPKNIKCEGNERMEMYPDALLHKGDSIKVGGYEVSVVSSGVFDKVKITKD